MVALLYGALIVCAVILSIMSGGLFARIIQDKRIGSMGLTIIICGIVLFFSASQRLIDHLKLITHNSTPEIVFIVVVVILITPAIIGAFKKRNQNAEPTGVSKSPSLTYPAHFKQTSTKAPGNKCELTLINAEEEGPTVHLTYQWKDYLSYSEADNLDTRLRAYIACAIYDAGTIAGLLCEPGMPHGERPAWHINKERIPISLINADFDVSNKICNQYIGRGIIIMGSREESAVWGKRLIKGFKTQFDNINV